MHRLIEFFPRLNEAEADPASVKALAQFGLKPGDRVKWYDRKTDSYRAGTIRMRSQFKNVPLVMPSGSGVGSVMVAPDDNPNVQAGVPLDQLIPENDPTPLH